MDSYLQAAYQIIKHQQVLMGPIALEEARKVAGLKVEDEEHVKIEGNGKEVLINLVKQYERILGRASVEVCREAVRESRPSIPSSDLPEVLQ